MKLEETPRVFLTDYASYNEGTQFEFGHWVDLDDYSDETELMEYISNHFDECDEKRPLLCGSEREEIMITDYEGFPKELYSESGGNFEQIYEFINLSDDQKIAVAFMIEQNCDLEYAIDHCEDVYLREFDRHGNDKIELFAEYYPEADKADDDHTYLRIDYDSFLENEFTEFEYEGTNYIIHDSWNH
ncbi:antirestriction protein ArdA [Aquimarina algiphila]|uniref:Antirestriction protein ArdA n=1 Tax=Aquimarina algiphila TaxID=2047982 RepID=A0A554VRQ6_9FLAO|nr:antirestriction protein ArdA [Aquimarina algiphila]TSE11325.1 antirestriction protein ArdA [Aquimarina algiphila]